ncbi:hypothetical protein [Streptomyces yangpuensis]|uniref:hypothetical protein n=1 Tax=Streptomyces yangpuensis TaxID=1648182 RepID=UPI0036477076
MPMQAADWPLMARRLVSLQQAGVDLGTFLPQMGRMTAGSIRPSPRTRPVSRSQAPTAGPTTF